MSCIDALVSKERYNCLCRCKHAVYYDGVRLHMGKRFTFKHNDIESLEKKTLERATKMGRTN